MLLPLFLQLRLQVLHRVHRLLLLGHELLLHIREVELVLLLWLVGLALHSLLDLLFDLGQLVVLDPVQLLDVRQGQLQLPEVLLLLFVEVVLLQELLLELVSLQGLVAVDLQVVLVLLDVLLEGIEVCIGALRLVVVQLLLAHLSKVLLAHLAVLLVLILHQDFVEVLCWLEEGDLVVLFEDDWGHHLLLGELVVVVQA